MPFFQKKTMPEPEKEKRINQTAENQMNDLISETPLRFEISIKKRSLIQKIRKEKSRVYEVRHLVLSDLIKINSLLDKCRNIFDVDGEYTVLKPIKFLSRHQKSIIEIISIFLQENDKQFLSKNLTEKDIINIILSISNRQEQASLFHTWGYLHQQMMMRNPTKTEK